MSILKSNFFEKPKFHWDFIKNNFLKYLQSSIVNKIFIKYKIAKYEK